MKIRWINHPSDKSKNGRTQHVAREVANVLVATEQAEIVPFKNFIERLDAHEAERAKQQPLPGSPMFYLEPHWAFREKSDRTGFLLVKHHRSDTTYFEMPPANSEPGYRAAWRRPEGIPDSIFDEWMRRNGEPLLRDAQRQREFDERQNLERSNKPFSAIDVLRTVALGR